jgi:hypothetical protein
MAPNQLWAIDRLAGGAAPFAHSTLISVIAGAAMAAGTTFPAGMGKSPSRRASARYKGFQGVSGAGLCFDQGLGRDFGVWGSWGGGGLSLRAKSHAKGLPSGTGNNNAARLAITARTTNSSMRVNALPLSMKNCRQIELFILTTLAKVPRSLFTAFTI